MAIHRGSSGSLLPTVKEGEVSDKVDHLLSALVKSVFGGCAVLSEGILGGAVSAACLHITQDDKFQNSLKRQII